MFPSATDECIRCYRLRYLLSLVSGYVFVGAVFTYSTILPVWSFCPRGVKTPSLFVAYFFRKNSNRFWWIYKMFIFSLVEHLEFNRANLVPRCHEVRGENKKDPYLHTRITGNTKKRTALVRLKRWSPCPLCRKSTSLKPRGRCALRIKDGTYSIARGTYNRIQFV